MKKIAFRLATILFIILLVWLLWPLAGNKYHFEWDEKAIAKKEQTLATLAADTTVDQPNILIILVDDLGKMDIPLYGGNDIVRTPNINRMAAQGIVFNQAYVSSPVCSPSRAALLTGRYQQRFGYQNQLHDRYLTNRLEYYGFKWFVDSHPWVPKWMDEVPNEEDIIKQGLPPSEITLPEVLQQGGYRTGLVGKWHLGWSDDNKPCNFGLDYQYGFYASHSLYAEENSPDIIDQKVEGDFTDPHIWSGQRDGQHAIYRNCAEISEDRYLTDAITEESIAFMEQRGDEPFFLLASYNAPHSPFQATQEYYDKYADVEDPLKRTYYAMIEHLDSGIGELLDYLETTGKDENTMIFFISDNGGATYTKTTDNGVLQGGKITDFEGGVAVPFIMQWAGKIRPGVTNEPVIAMDIFNTSIESAGFLSSQLPKTDGINLLPLLTDSATIELAERPFYWERGSSKAIRTSNWKMMWHTERQDTLLYHISVDPLETEDVYQQFKDQQVITELLSQYNQWSAQNQLPLWPEMIYFLEEIDGRWFYFDN